MSAANGGPAFPSKRRVMRAGYTTNEFEPVDGMSLRDYLAAKALQGMLADLPQSLYGLDWMEKTTASAYAVADAMLAARKGGAS